MKHRAYAILLEPNRMDLTELRLAIDGIKAEGLGHVLQYAENVYVLTTDLWITDLRDRLYPLITGFSDMIILELRNAIWTGRGDTVGYLDGALTHWLAESMPDENG